MPVLLCFGDSNTHGSPPKPEPRHGADVRWPRTALAALGPEWELVEEGLPGRTAQFPDPIMGDHMDGRPGLKIALASHAPIDWLAIMLGTNDVKARFAPTPERVTAGIAALLDHALSEEVQLKHGGFRILLICPPPVVETGHLAGEFFGGAAVSAGLPPLYAALARARGCVFLDAGRHVAVSAVDGVHYDAEGQRALGAAVAETLRAQ